MSTLSPDVLRTLPRSPRLAVAAAGLLAFGTATLTSQTPSTDQAFEVASIHRNKDDEERRVVILQRDPNAPIPPGRAQTLPGGRFQGRGMTVRELIRDAYGYRNRPAADVVGGPKWIDSERYDVQARGPEYPLSTTLGLPPKAEAALRALLAERMHLQVRVESRRQRVYELVMARDDRRPGTGLAPAKGGCLNMYAREALTPLMAQQKPSADSPPPTRPCMLGISLAMVVAENFTMEDWARFLAAFPQINANVIDRTSLTGSFDIKITNPAAGDPGGTTLLPAVEPALESQLGLKLRPAEGTVDVLVIESVERPTEN